MKILRKIYGPIYNVDSGIFERRRNVELQRPYNNPSICQFIRSKTIREYNGQATCGGQMDASYGRLWGGTRLERGP